MPRTEEDVDVRVAFVCIVPLRVEQLVASYT